MGIVPSIEMVIWVAVGGRGSLIGAIIGAILVNALKSGLSESFPDIWQYFFGALFIGSVLLFPQGLVGAIRRLRPQANTAPIAAAPAVQVKEPS
jgi:urea transport system permease protein